MGDGRRASDSGSNVMDKSISAQGKTDDAQVRREAFRRDYRDTGMKIDAANPPPKEIRDQYEQTTDGWKPKEAGTVFKDFSKSYKRGGKVKGKGKRDTVKARLTPGEFVVTASAAKKNMPTLRRMNRGDGLRNVRSF